MRGLGCVESSPITTQTQCQQQGRIDGSDDVEPVPGDTVPDGEERAADARGAREEGPLAELKLREQRAAALLAQKDALLAELKRKEQLLRAELSQKKALLAEIKRKKQLAAAAGRRARARTPLPAPAASTLPPAIA
ncbi:hypothetical protein PVAP13_8KG051002 [Panicum virgatum]|uniref:Uncharacterized protein n=1 Tax=Panicum virgatum TaxID=38727 RepID=A0A8T0PIU6_PANVG|nr:hypothetical protein PVAP13_8KG051002 [Panicum virgatum]